MTSKSNMGKGAEQLVKKHLLFLEGKYAQFTFNRVQDAHAAGGRFTPQPGDFAWYIDGSYAFPSGGGHLWVPEAGHGLPAPRSGLLEVKEVKHDFRLPAKNYSADKVARVAKRTLAGCLALVLVNHTTNDTWRAVPLTVFQNRGKPSWDLSQWPLVDYRQALNEFIGVANG